MMQIRRKLIFMRNCFNFGLRIEDFGFILIADWLRRARGIWRRFAIGAFGLPLGFGFSISDLNV